MVRNCATRPGELIINPQTKPYVDWMRFGVSAIPAILELATAGSRFSLLLQFFQKSLKVGDSLTDALLLMPGKPEAMHEALCGVVGFLGIHDFALPCSRTG